jgi:hypothetical protein
MPKVKIRCESCKQIYNISRDVLLKSHEDFICNLCLVSKERFEKRKRAAVEFAEKLLTRNRSCYHGH